MGGGDTGCDIQTEERPWRPRGETALSAGPYGWRAKRASDPERRHRQERHTHKHTHTYTYTYTEAQDNARLPVNAFTIKRLIDETPQKKSQNND